MSTTSELTINKDSPVFVSGATGYVAGVLIQQLLELGLTVHGAVRDPSKTDRLQHLIDLADNSPGGSIKFFKGDLLQPGSYAEAMENCSIVFHTASPFAMDVKDPMKELIEPAVDGTKNVLNQASKTPSVKRLILTSSATAIFTDALDTYSAPNNILTEEVWNRTASIDYMPYYLSKTMAEQAAWTLAGSQNQWTMAVINPTLVMGPGIKYHASSESFTNLKLIAGGDMAMGCPNFNIPIVDVRDVARAHVVAAFKTESAKGRHIIHGASTTFFEMANALRPKYADYPLPNRTIPKIILWLIGPWLGLKRRFIWNNINYPFNFDTTKSKEMLGIKYRPLESTMQEMMQQMIDAGALKKK